MIKIWIAVFSLALSFSVLAAEKWYEGGSLHKSSPAEWRKSSHKNKMATAADWVLSRPSILKKVKKSGNINTGRPYATELVKCIETSLKGVNAGGSTAEIAAACMVLMGWE